MKYLKKFIILTILITFVVGLFYYVDREKYFIGKSYFDYKLLPYGLRPEYYCSPYQMGDHWKYEFQIVVNGFEDYGEGTACYNDSTRDRYFIIKKSRCTISGEKNESNEKNEKNETNGKSDWSVSFVVSLRQKHSCFASDQRSSGTLNVEQSLSRICNPTAPSISICNALINNI